MERMIFDKRMRRYALTLVCVPLTLLAGCPQSNTTAPGKVAPQATAPVIAPTTPQVDAAKAAEDEAKTRKVQELIGQAEGSYRSGVSNYRGGRLDAASAWTSITRFI